MVGSFFGGPRAASDGHSAAGFKSASSTPPRTPCLSVARAHCARLRSDMAKTVACVLAA